MELSTLQLFVEIVRSGSFAAVARVRGVDPSSVSRAIAALEKDLGLRLFQRTTRRLAPTEAGMRYFHRVEPLLEEFERARLSAAEAAQQPRGVLRITAPVSFTQLHLVPLLPEWARRYPELNLELLSTNAIVDLLEQRVDVAVRLGALPDSSLVGRRLRSMDYVVCASPDYLQRHGEPQAPADLRHHECLRFPVPAYGARWRFRCRDGDIEGVPVAGRFVIANGLALRDCAVAGLGVALLPRWNVAREIDDGRLRALLDDYQATASQFDIAAWIVYPSRSYLPLKVRVFVDFLMEKLGRNEITA